MQAVVAGALARAGPGADRLSALGITNQRETTVLWDRATGKPVHNAIVWQDTRTSALCRQLGGTDGQDRFREPTGLPLASYFSGPKVAWLLDHVPGLRARAERGEIAFGTMDSWLVWRGPSPSPGRWCGGSATSSASSVTPTRSSRWPRAWRTTGAYIVPAFSGLFAPYWRSDTRGVVTGLTRYVTKAHLARAALEATSRQTRVVVDAMHQVSGGADHDPEGRLGHDQEQSADAAPGGRAGRAGDPPPVSETTCLGAAYAAGVATGVWSSLDELRAHWQRDAEWAPVMEASVREGKYRNWRRAVEKSLGWTEDDDTP
ncbi:FGGY family carbohydrate kinase [Streptomyces tendae]